MAFWDPMLDDLAIARIRQDSGLTTDQVRAGTLATMDAFIAARVEANGVRTRKEIDNASGIYAFTADGFDAEALAGLFPQKSPAQRDAEGEDYLTLAMGVVRERVLSDLNARVTGENFASGTGTANFHERQADAIMKDITASIQSALLGPQRDAPDPTSGGARRSGSVRVGVLWPDHSSARVGI